MGQSFIMNVRKPDHGYRHSRYRPLWPHDPANRMRQPPTRDLRIPGRSVSGADRSGSKHRTEKRIVHYDDRGAPTSETDFFYDVHGAVTSLDLIHFGLHGERSWEIGRA